MKKILLCLFLLSFSLFLKAQDIESSKVFQLLNDNKAKTGLSTDDMNNFIITNAFFNKTSGTELVYLQQSYKGIPVLNQIQVLAFKNGSLVANSGGRIKNIVTKVNTQTITPAVTAETAVRTSAAAKNLPLEQSLNGTTNGNKVDFGKLGIANTNITATLMWVPAENGMVKLAWQVYLVPKTTPDYFLIRIDAIANTIIILMFAAQQTITF